ncbi:hypothetical protein CYMTET_51673 [Cymbomonas tetramitiformis]|uniref:Uncharacterized protein n=1 Tax=Cymbomonas tetramitiformis TaxID=36881 RepID=A0AAE0BKJ3_9CHLO|nr:hypothetical protein CYMTET_51673 [Cymbomonas tetramitiformis]
MIHLTAHVTFKGSERKTYNLIVGEHLRGNDDTKESSVVQYVPEEAVHVSLSKETLPCDLPTGKCLRYGIFESQGDDVGTRLNILTQRERCKGLRFYAGGSTQISPQLAEVQRFLRDFLKGPVTLASLDDSARGTKWETNARLRAGTEPALQFRLCLEEGLDGEQTGWVNLLHAGNSSPSPLPLPNPPPSPPLLPNPSPSPLPSLPFPQEARLPADCSVHVGWCTSDGSEHPSADLVGSLSEGIFPKCQVYLVQLDKNGLGSDGEVDPRVELMICTGWFYSDKVFQTRRLGEDTTSVPKLPARFGTWSQEYSFMWPPMAAHVPHVRGRPLLVAVNGAIHHAKGECRRRVTSYYDVMIDTKQSANLEDHCSDTPVFYWPEVVTKFLERHKPGQGVTAATARLEETLGEPEDAMRNGAKLLAQKKKMCAAVTQHQTCDKRDDTRFRSVVPRGSPRPAPPPGPHQGVRVSISRRTWWANDLSHAPHGSLNQEALADDLPPCETEE